MHAQRFEVVYILPSRYDDEGYVHRYVWGVLPSNTLFCLRSLTLDAVNKGILGEDVDVNVHVFDDSVHRIDPERIVRNARRRNAKLLVGFVGVQSNQFPRAADLATAFRKHNVSVILGGFHVSGVYALFNEPDPPMQQLLDAGVTLVAGEVEGEGVLDGILRDAWRGSLQPVYRVTETPAITDAVVPAPDSAYLRRFIGHMGTLDTSRGCPFNCSFCTIINVQGRKMRHRSPETMLRSIEEHYKKGIIYYFFTDDNFSRSPAWKELFDGLKQLRQQGKDVQFMMQVDTQAWRLPGFIQRAREAGCFLVFIGMETINEKNLQAASKRQNKAGQYAEMVDAWHRAGILVHVGFIIGFPHDTVESVRADLATLREGIKVDEASFFMLTPLPGSRDHLEMVNKKTPLDADLNNYDSFHETFRHPLIPPGAWYDLYVQAWDDFYSKENVTNVLMRTPAERYWRMFWLALWNRYATLHRTHTMITGVLRRKDRKFRRSIFPIETRLQYTRRRARDWAREAAIFGQLFVDFQEIWLLTRKKEGEHWNVLADLRARWGEAQERMAALPNESSVDIAVAEIRAMLQACAEEIGDLAMSDAVKSRRLQRGLENLAEEARLALLAFDKETIAPEGLDDMRHYIRDGLLARYEELAIRHVARRRRCNRLRRDVMSRLRRGRLPKLRSLTNLPKAIFDEGLLGARFLYAFLHATMHRLRVA